jgi:hypothetical protein
LPFFVSRNIRRTFFLKQPIYQQPHFLQGKSTPHCDRMSRAAGLAIRMSRAAGLAIWHLSTQKWFSQYDFDDEAGNGRTQSLSTSALINNAG